MARAFIELVGDWVSAHKAITGTEADLASLAGTADKTAASVDTANSTMTDSMAAFQVKAAEAAKVEIDRNARIIASNEARMASYREMYATADAGLASNLNAAYITRAKRVERLGGTAATDITGAAIVGGAAAREEGSLGRDSKDVSQFLRGGVKGAGGLGGLGFAALAGGTFIGAYAGAAALRSVIDAATKAQASEKLLAQATQSAGASYSAWRPEIDKTVASLSNQTGFTEDQVRSGLVPLIRATGNVTEAMKLSGLAADIARGRNLDYNTSALLVSKVVNGNTGLFKRYGVEVQNGATVQEALAAAQQKFAGAAEAYGKTTAGSLNRVHAAVQRAEEEIGKALLPTIHRLSNEFANWLDKMERSGKLQKDVNETFRITHTVLSDIHTVLGGVISGFESLAHVVMGVKGALDSMNNAAHSALDDVGGFFKTISGYNELHALYGGGGSSPSAVGHPDSAAERRRAQAEDDYYRRHRHLYPGRGNQGGTLDSFAISNLPQALQNQIASAVSPAQKRAADEAEIAAIDKLLHKKGALSPAARTQAEKDRSAAEKQLAEIQKSQAAATKSAQSKAVSSVSHDQLLAQAKLDLAQGDTAAADRLLRTDKARLEEELKQAKTADMRLALTKQLTAVETELHAKDATFVESMKLQVAQARADALAALGGQSPTALQIKLAKELKAAAMKAIHSHHLTMQGLIDAWNAVAQANSVLAQAQGDVNTYHAISAKTIVGAVAGLTAAQKLQLRERISQSEAHRGHRPRGTGADGQDVHVTIHADTNQTVANVDKHHRRKHQRAGGRR